MDVRIHKPAKSSMQSGRGRTKDWVLEYEPATPRRPEPLMGWSASGDTLNQVRIAFHTREEAIAFAEAKGWTYTVTEPHERIVRPRNYTDNFKSVPPLE